MVSYFLAVALMFDLSTKPPLMVRPFQSSEACYTEAIIRNNKLDEDKKKAGMAYICLKVELPPA